jgi:hypothetical protein
MTLKWCCKPVLQDDSQKVLRAGTAKLSLKMTLENDVETAPAK